MAIGHRDSWYQLSGTIELEDTLVGGRQKGKLGRGSAGKNTMRLVSESKDKKGFIAMAVVDSISYFSVNKFVKKHLKQGK
ncbi:hypothetical protein CXF71_17735 [Colwellia sp. 12G3]|nr:hypothetical protein CXF71_17735 [Colwellia sp. 12G3]